MTEQETAKWHDWRIIENPRDGTSQFGARVVSGYGLETVIQAMFVNTAAAHEYLVLRRQVEALTAERDSLREWKEVVLDEATIDFIGEDWNNPRKLLRHIINWNQMVALDPEVSEAAVKLRDTFRKKADLADRIRSQAGIAESEGTDGNHSAHILRGFMLEWLADYDAIQKLVGP